MLKNKGTKGKKGYNDMVKKENVIIIGAGPCGLSVGVELKKQGIDPLFIEKGSLVQSIYNYPTFMQFHSTPDLLEIGDIPFITSNERPNRIEALSYYRTVAKRDDLRINKYEAVQSIERKGLGFLLKTADRFEAPNSYEASNVVIATGFFNHPNRLGVPGEMLSKVSSFYKEAHPYAGMKVAVVGGNSSAIDAALDLERGGAEVTLIYRREELSSRIKSWIRPSFDSKVRKGRIQLLLSSHVKEIVHDAIKVETPDGLKDVKNDFVFTLIGYRPDRRFLSSLGAKIDDATGVPLFNAETMETNIPHLYIAGAIATGSHETQIFIENGRFHGELIARQLAAQMNS